MKSNFNSITGYPIIKIPEEILNEFNREISNEEIIESLGQKYPKLDLNIYLEISESFSIFDKNRDSNLTKFKERFTNHYTKSENIESINEILINQYHQTEIKYFAKIRKTIESYFDDENKSNHYYIEKKLLPFSPEKHKINKVEKTNWGCVAILVIISVVILLISSKFNLTTFFFFSITTSLILIMLFINMKPIITDEKIYKSKADYEEEKGNVEKIIEKVKREVKQEYENKKVESDNLANIKRAEVEKKIFYDKLKPKIKLLKGVNNLNKGRSETYFLKYLRNKFDNQILVDVYPNMGKNPYQPDFVLVCKKTGFHIEIEIDEPYSTDNGKPIHHDESDDETRDDFFIEINWGIIRFTERQITNSPTQCCELIENVLLAITKKESKFINNVIIEKKWTYEEATIMSNNNYRNSYLPNNLKVNIKYRENDQYDDLPF